MSGRPSSANIGITNGIVITAKDRKRGTARLPAFNLAVLRTDNAPVANGTPVNTTVENGNGSIPSPTPINTVGTQPTDLVISDNPTTSPTVPVEVQPVAPVIGGSPITPAMVLEDALRTGDASKVTTEALLNAGIVQAQSESNYCSTELAKVYPNTLQQTLFPTRSAYMSSNSARNVPLHAAINGELRVYSWMGKKETGSPYAVLGTNVFSFTTVNTELKNITLNLLNWLLNKDAGIDILSQPLVVLVPGYWDRQSLND
jgi:hypothetical protein